MVEFCEMSYSDALVSSLYKAGYWCYTGGKHEKFSSQSASFFSTYPVWISAGSSASQYRCDCYDINELCRRTPFKVEWRKKKIQSFPVFLLFMELASSLPPKIVRKEIKLYQLHIHLLFLLQEAGMLQDCRSIFFFFFFLHNSKLK